MTRNSTQTGHIPKESSSEINDDQDYNIDQSLMNENVIISQQPLIQFNAINMIPSQTPSIPSRIQSIPFHIPQYENHTWNQLGRRRPRRRQRRQQRRQLRQQQQHRQQRWQQRGQQTETQQQQQQQQQQIRYPRYRRWSSLDREREYWEWLGYPEYMEENISPVLENYYWEKMHPNERQEIWEQNHLNELQNNTTLEQQDPLDYLEAFAVLEHLTLIQDEIEQIHQINAIEELEAEELQQRHNAEQIQVQQWEKNNFEEYAIEQQNKLIHD